MSFGAAIKSFWSNYVNFRGRARRSEYWFITLFLFITTLGASIIDVAIFADDLDEFLMNGGWGPVGVIWALAVLLPSLSVLARRLHDTNRSAWWILLALVPLVGAVILLVFTLLDSTQGENKYGPSPKHSV
jgi:uncharacterized membrane protein YhaH (DUF805 family)